MITSLCFDDDYYDENYYYSIYGNVTGNWAVAKKFAEKNKYTVVASTEMIAYGLCNLLGSLFQSFVVAGGFARSAVNAEGGAQTPAAGLISGMCILVSLQFFTSLFYYLPLATLGAIIVVSVVSMMDFQKMLLAYRKGFYQDFIIILSSFLCTFFLGVAMGLLCGIALSVGGMLYSTSSADFNTVSSGDMSPLLGLTPPSSADGSGSGDTALNIVNEQKTIGTGDHDESLFSAGSFQIIQMSSLLYFGNLDNFKDSVMEATHSLVQAIRLKAPALSTRSLSPPVYPLVTQYVFGAVVVDASSWGHYMELYSASALDELRLNLLAPKLLYPPSPSRSASLPPPSPNIEETDAIIVIKLGLVNCHPSVLKNLAAIGIVEKIGIDMIFSSTVDCLQNCGHRLHQMHLRDIKKLTTNRVNDDDTFPIAHGNDSMSGRGVGEEEEVLTSNVPLPLLNANTSNTNTKASYMKISSPTQKIILSVINVGEDNI